MDEVLQRALRSAVGTCEAYYVGGCLRDLALGREVLDVDVASDEAEEIARVFHRQSGEAIFELSTRHGAWRVLLRTGLTVDFVALRGSIEEDLALRDFTANAIARDVHTDAYLDPLHGLDDLTAGVLRAVSSQVFEDDPLRLLRAVRLEDELPLVLEPETESLVRGHALAVTRPAGERILAELERLSPSGFMRLEELGLLAALGGTTERLGHLGISASSELVLVAALGAKLLELPVPRELARMTRTLARAQAPAADDARSIHRFRRATEPWAVEALYYLGATKSVPAVLAARDVDPATPLLRGDELGLPPGPEVGQLLELIAEERAAGTISTRDKAMALVANRRV
ncbi:MAG: hypothetical protein ACR2OD_01065 [Gaiellaceae bacterium]